MLVFRILAYGLLLIFALIALPPLWYSVFRDPPPELPAAGRRVEVAAGRSVNVIEEGNGPSVLLVHGHGASAYDWSKLMGELSRRGYRAIAYDRMGYGYSDRREPGRVTVETNAFELLHLIEALDLSDVTLVGWSYGGGMSIIAARHDPSRIGRIVLVGSVGDRVGERDTVPRAPDFLVEFLTGPVFLWISSVPPLADPLGKAFRETAFSPDPVPAWYERVSAANFGRPNTVDAFRSEGRDLGGQANLDPSEIGLPILLIHGRDDKMSPFFVAEDIHSRAPRSELRGVPDSGHMLPITHPELIAEEIQAFVPSSAAGRAPVGPTR